MNSPTRKKIKRMKQEYKPLITEELSKEDIDDVKELIRTTLTRLFYTLYVKKNFWEK